MKTHKPYLIILVLAFLSLGLANDLAAQRANTYSHTFSSGTHTLELAVSSNYPGKFRVRLDDPSGSWDATIYDYLGDITVSGGATVTLEFANIADNTQSFPMTGIIKVTDGQLTIKQTNQADGGYSLLKRHKNYTGSLIVVESSKNLASSCKLEIIGYDATHPFIIDGNGSEFSINSSSSGYTATQASGSNYTIAAAPLIHVKGGTLNMTDVLLRRNWTTTGAGAIRYENGEYSSKSTAVESTLTRTEIRRCYTNDAGNGSAITIAVRKYKGNHNGYDSSIEMVNCKVNGCFSNNGGAIIRTNINNRAELSMNGCEIKNNYNTRDKSTNAAILCWNSYTTNPLTMENCTIQNNWCKYNGCITIMTSATFTNCTIKDNISLKNGAGIFFMQYGDAITGNDLTTSDITNNVITLNKTIIEHNTASEDGGGICMIIGGVYKGTISDSDPTVNLLERTVTLNISGGRIGGTANGTGNTARHGGGIYVRREPHITFANTLNINASDTYDDALCDALIQYNTASSGSLGGGGGIALGGGIVLNLNGTDTHAVKIQNNTAKEYGGGISVNGTVNVDKYLIVKDNTTVAGAADNVFIRSGATQKFVGIGTNGLSCGSEVGVSKTTTEHTYSTTTDNGTVHYTQIAGGTTANCQSAYDRDCFFDDTKLYSVYYWNKSPYTANTGLYFIETWRTNANDSGISTSDDVITVSTAAGLAYIAKQVTEGNTYSGKTIELSGNIDLNGHYWEPIGNYKSDVSCGETLKSFLGTFDGKGYAITNMNSSLPCKGLGLIGFVEGSATVKNVFVNSGTLNGTSSHSVGGVVGRMFGGTMENCAATVTFTGGGTYVGGLVGTLASSGNIHSSYAIPTLNAGVTRGGLVGGITAGTLKNCYANTGYTNGLVGSNAGTVQNCYVRGTSGFVGSGSGTVDYCYASAGSASGTNGVYTEATSTYLYKDLDEQVTALEGNTYVPKRNNKQLLETLNNWVDAQSTPNDYSRWVRPTTATINADYPVLRMNDFYAVASNGGDLIYGTATGSTKNLLTSFTEAGYAICLYKSLANISANSTYDAKLYIDPDVAVTQAGVNKAYVGVWLDNSADAEGYGANPSQGGTDAIDWHLFSSALDNLPIGFTYNTSGYTPGYGNNPPAVTFTTPKTGYFPTNLATYNTEWDFYSYAEPDYHWVNMKRASNDHWHSDYDYWPIHYDNEAHFVSGRGYLVATAEDCFLQGYGTLKKGDLDPYPLSYTPDIAHTGRNGFNVLGNPYQSYLDFDQFATTNSDIWEGGKDNSGYIAMDEDRNGYVYYAYGSSANPYVGSQYLHPHQGFIVMACKTGLTATFTEAMRSVSGTASFRDERPNYPLVNLIVTESSGNRDLCTVELGRPDKGGLVKADGVRAGKSSISCHYDDEDWAIVFTLPGLDMANIRFETAEADTFTLTWDTENGDFSYLHLIDNMTGADIDCLTTEEYSFTATPDDYKSRFKLMFGYTGIDEPESPEPVEGPTTFAFRVGDELVVNGEGQLEVFDMTGRKMMTEKVQGSQSKVRIPRVSAGVYVLRLTGRDGVRTQKMVVN